jgi:hypothetical protein
MQYSCYHYYSENNAKIIIFILNKNILNIYIGTDVHNINKLNPLFVITEKKMKQYPYLYKIYFTSILLTKNGNKLDYNSIYYSINKRIIWKNLYITNSYNDTNAYFSEFPKFSFNITNNDKIDNIMSFIISEIKLIDEKLLLELIDEEEIKLKRELKYCEKYFNYVNANRIILSKVLPNNFSEDLHYFILNYFC